MKFIDDPIEIMRLADQHMVALNEEVYGAMRSTVENPDDLTPHIAKMREMFNAIAAQKMGPNGLGLVLMNSLLRSLALLRLFPPQLFNRMLSDALAGVGVVNWTQESLQLPVVTEVTDAPGN